MECETSRFMIVMTIMTSSPDLTLPYLLALAAVLTLIHV